MATLLDKIQSDLKDALKAKDSGRLSVLRMLKSELQYEMTRTGADSLSDNETEAIIKRAVKKRKESIDQYLKGDRKDLAAAEEEEIKILSVYLPEELSREAVEKIVDEVISSMSDTSNIGKVMGPVMGKLKGQNVDGALVKEIVQNKLQG